MAQGYANCTKFKLRNRAKLSKDCPPTFILLLVMLIPIGGLYGEEIQDITGKYHFLTADDTLAILEEEGKLKGYVDAFQGEQESDTILSYPITLGWRKKDHVEFKTGKIHEKYFRFTGTVQRGAGNEETEPDYLRLVGDLEIVTVKGESQEDAVQRMRVVFKSMGKKEQDEE